MSTDDFITALFIRVDTIMADVPKHPNANLYPSEIVTLALLFALKGVGPRHRLLAAQQLSEMVSSPAGTDAAVSPVCHPCGLG